MRLLVDTHTHTVVSGHAFSTLLENLDFAAKRDLEGIVTSEHSEKAVSYTHLLALFGHRENIKRLCNGTENKLSFHK